MSSLCWKVNSEVYLKYIVILNIPWHFLGFHFSIFFATEHGLKCFHFFVVVYFLSWCLHCWDLPVNFC